MAKDGPVPKRSGTKAGNPTGHEVTPDKPLVSGSVSPPPAAKGWAKEARAWYRSLAQSGQARYFEPSDWEVARILARLLSDELGLQRPRPDMVKAVLSGMDQLGSTEGARRRMRIEVERAVESGGDEAAEVAVMEQYRQAVG